MARKSRPTCCWGVYKTFRGQPFVHQGIGVYEMLLRWEKARGIKCGRAAARSRQGHGVLLCREEGLLCLGGERFARVHCFKRRAGHPKRDGGEPSGDGRWPPHKVAWLVRYESTSKRVGGEGRRQLPASGACSQPAGQLENSAAAGGWGTRATG